MALVAVTELVDPRAMVEIEATAVIPPVRQGRDRGEAEAADATAAIAQAQSGPGHATRPNSSTEKP